MDRRVFALAMIAACASTLALGLVTGVIVTRLMDRDRPPARAPRFERGMPQPEGPPLEVLGHMLGLSPEQHGRIATLIDSSRRDLRATRDSLRVRIDRELTPEQRERWREWTRRAPGPRSERLHGRTDRTPPPAPPGEGDPR